MNEDSSDPGGHQVGLGRPEVDVENHNSHTNAEKFTFEDKHRDSHQSEEDKYANRNKKITKREIVSFPPSQTHGFEKLC